MPQRKATTLRDVARDVGVSIMTASLVLNGSPPSNRVSESTRARILDAASRLRYVPNAVARGLSRRRMNNIGIIGEIQGPALNLYFFEVLSGVMDVATLRKQNTTILSISTWELDQDRIVQFCDGRIDGVILLAPDLIGTRVARAIGEQPPFVVIHCDCDPSSADEVECDDEGGIRDVVLYLASLGHRRIAYIGGPLGRASARRRLNGYRLGLQDTGLSFDSDLVEHDWYGPVSGRNMTKRFIERFGANAMPTAICCASDAIAVGCIETLTAHGLRVPGDISVTGFDGLLLSQMTTPTLTTVKQPLRLMGRYAVERLLTRIAESIGEVELGGSRIATPDHSPEAPALASRLEPTTKVFPCELVIRDSSGPPRANVTA